MKRQFGEQGKARIHILSGPISERKTPVLEIVQSEELYKFFKRTPPHRVLSIS